MENKYSVEMRNRADNSGEMWIHFLVNEEELKDIIRIFSKKFYLTIHNNKQD